MIDPARNKRHEARNIAQLLLHEHFPGALAVLVEQIKFPRYSEWAELELHVFYVPQGKNAECVKLLLDSLYRAPFSEDDSLVVHPHSVAVTEEHYADLLPESWASLDKPIPTRKAVFVGGIDGVERDALVLVALEPMTLVLNPGTPQERQLELHRGLKELPQFGRDFYFVAEPPWLGVIKFVS